MIDREKVIKGVECHRKKVQTTNAVSCLECPYSEPNPIREWCMSGLMDDIYVLLKEQEPVKPIPPSNENDLWRCGNCQHQLLRLAHNRYCECCGRKVKWDD